MSILIFQTTHDARTMKNGTVVGCHTCWVVFLVPLLFSDRFSLFLFFSQWAPWPFRWLRWEPRWRRRTYLPPWPRRRPRGRRWGGVLQDLVFFAVPKAVRGSAKKRDGDAPHALGVCVHWRSRDYLAEVPFFFCFLFCLLSPHACFNLDQSRAVTVPSFYVLGYRSYCKAEWFLSKNAKALLYSSTAGSTLGPDSSLDIFPYYHPTTPFSPLHCHTPEFSVL